MLRVFFLALSVCALAGFHSPDTRADSPIGGGWASLFDGTSLQGWHFRPHINPREVESMDGSQRAAKMEQWDREGLDHWRIEAGVLVNDGEGPYLVSDGRFEDYELELEYKITAGTDSGIYLKGNPQVQIWDPDDESQFKNGSQFGSGGLWNNPKDAPGQRPLVRADAPIGKWNRLWIRQTGARTTVKLNDQVVVDHAIMRNYWNPLSPLPRGGTIQLQTHGGETRWRNIRLRELTPKESNAMLADQAKTAFKPIFDGKSLAGWVGAVDNYEVVDGAIRCREGQGGTLLTAEQFEDFVVRLEFRLPAEGNNGLAIRAPLEGDPAYVGMCELQILDSDDRPDEDLDARQVHGSAYGMAAAATGYLRPVGEWNFQEVTVEGSRVRVELNGNVILDADLDEISEYLDDRAHPGKDRTRGHFGFAGHGDPVEFRGVSIRPLH